jgi:ABC-type transport system involved in multi-copper enzyme maturation permease subunit
MFRVLLWKEIREHLLTFRFAAALVTTFMLVVFSIWILGEDFLRRRDNYNKLSEEAARATSEVKIPSLLEPIVHHPPSPLGIFASGEEKRLGNAVRIMRWEVPDEATDSLTDNPLLSAIPSFDMLAVFTLVVSLFGIILTYDSITGEKERGTLRQLCATGTGKSRLFAAKFIAGAAVLAIPVLFSFISGLVVLRLMLNINFTPDQWLAIIFMLAAGLLFGALFIALGLMCSALVGRSATALILSLLLWTLGILIIPLSAESLASAFYPLPPHSEIINLEKTTSDEVNAEINPIFYQKIKKARAEGGLDINGAFATDGPDIYLADGNPRTFVFYREMVGIMEPLWQGRADRIWNLEKEHDARFRKQRDLADLFCVPSPSRYLREILTSLAATDYQSHAYFLDMARRFRSGMLKIFRDNGYFDRNAIQFITRIPTEEALSEQKCAERQAAPGYWENLDLENLPPLPGNLLPQVDSDSSGPRFQECIQPAAILALMLLLFFSIGHVAFIRYDVR